MSRARVLLLEDDELVRSLVGFAVEDMGIELVIATNVPEAEEALATAPARLFISDLMLPGESGQSFIARYCQSQAFDPRMRIAVFSAGLTPSVRQQLQGLPLWRVMSKPASITTIRDCVSEALQAWELADCQAAHEAPIPEQPAQAPGSIAEFFGRDKALFESFRASCAAQFVADLQRGDEAARSGHVAELTRLGHNLKTVLKILGHEELSRVAGELEFLQEADAADAARLWAYLRRDLAPLAAAT